MPGVEGRCRVGRVVPATSTEDRVAVVAALAAEHPVLELVARLAADVRPLDRGLVAVDGARVVRRERRRDAEQLDAGPSPSP